MKRTEFIKLCATSALSLCMPANLFPLNSRLFTNKDKYGGWTGKSFEATGFFRTEKADRWWLVTPEGNAFLSFGINHFHPGWWKAPYNLESWMKLLDVNEPDQFDPALRSWFLKTCREYGFNTAGVHTDVSLLNNPQPLIPYMRPIHFVDISHWKPAILDENFKDVFSVEFYQHCDQLANEIALPLKDDPYLLGYAMADCPLFTEDDCRERPDTVGGARRKARIGWPRRLRNLGKSSPGKQAYVKTMAEIYRGDIQEFNRTYTTAFKSFDELEAAEQWRMETDRANANETRDNIEFLHVVIDKYYKTAKEAIQRYDPNHLFFGDKINANTDSVDRVLPVTSKYTDVLFYQMYAKYEVQRPGLDRWKTRIDMPVINGDSRYATVQENIPRPYGPVADSEIQNAEWTSEFFYNAFARPEFVGWHYCGLIDTPVKLVSKESERQHAGLFDGYGKPYSDLKQAITKCSNELYEIASH